MDTPQVRVRNLCPEGRERAGVSAEKSSLPNAGDLSQRFKLLIIAPKEHFKNESVFKQQVSFTDLDSPVSWKTLVYAECIAVPQKDTSQVE